MCQGVVCRIDLGQAWCSRCCWNHHGVKGVAGSAEPSTTKKLRFTSALKLRMLLHGIFPPITTPFYPDGNVYFKKLESNVERYSRTPVAGIVVQGSTGEAIMLSDQERRDVLKVARAAAAPDKVLIAGTGIESAIETLRLTEYAAELGYDVA